MYYVDTQPSYSYVLTHGTMIRPLGAVVCFLRSPARVCLAYHVMPRGACQPHRGLAKLKEMGGAKPKGSLESSVDGASSRQYCRNFAVCEKHRLIEVGKNRARNPTNYCSG